MVTAAMNQAEAFRHRIEAGEVVPHGQLRPYFSYLAPDKKYFRTVLAQMGKISLLSLR